MSGPKIDRVELERRRAMKLAAERSRNDSLIRNALLQLSKKMREYEARALEVRKNGSGFCQELERLEKDMRASFIEAATSGYPSDPDKATVFNYAVTGRLQRMVEDISNQAAPIIARIESALGRQKDIEDIESLLSGDSSAEYGYLSSNLIRVLIERAESANRSYLADLSSASVQTLEEAEETMRRIRLAIVSDATDVPRKQQLTSMARRINESLMAYDAGDVGIGSVRQLLSVVELVLKEIEEHVQVMNELYFDSLIANSRIEQAVGFSAELKPIWQFGEEEDLEATLCNLKNFSRKCAEDAYVVQSLDEVMAKHGYSIAKPIKLNEAGQEGHRMFMTEANDIGIHTYLASNGMLAMEVGAVDESVFAQNENEPVQKQQANSSYDKLRLVHEQEVFCELHPEIISDLAAYGICVNPIKDRKPSEDCAVVFSALRRSVASEERSESKRSSRRSEKGFAEREMR